MVITKLKGGLGNQMFQYAAARGIDKKNQEIIIDNSFLDNNSISTENFTAKTFELSIFRGVRIKDLSHLYKNRPGKSGVFYNFIRQKLLDLTLKKIVQQENEYVEELHKLSGNIYMDGYFQSEKYFVGKREQLLTEFAFPPIDEKNAKLRDIIRNEINPVSVHIRRGDYLKPLVLSYLGLLPMSYYKKAIARMETELNNPTFYFFSDDPDWCKNNFTFLGDKAVIVEGNPDTVAWKDMYLMSQFKHHIIANSSFSWWGAWLSQQKGINLAPYKWFNPETAKFNIHDFVPESWKIVEYE